MTMKTDERNKFAIKSFLGEYLDLKKDKDNELETVDSIRKGVEFKGANLWILIFAIFMASLGLNVNSTAVIIGAMLISPLMGPIMGVGLSVGLNDFELMKRSLKSFLITTAFSVTTATIFFLLLLLQKRNQNCWHELHQRFMTYSSHSSVVWQALSLFLPRRKEM